MPYVAGTLTLLDATGSAMSAWDEVLRQLALFTTAFLGILLAVIGDLVRLFHEQERGGQKVTLWHIPASLLRGALLGVIAVTLGNYLYAQFGLPELIGASLGGILGYKGPGAINQIVQIAKERLLPPKPKDPEDDA